MDYEQLYDLLKDLMIDYLSDKGWLEDEEEHRDEWEQDEIVQAIDTLCDYLEGKDW